ncbi:hypothetical protein [Nodosilinea nodulosa]|uniref:hypothetical protein n=1 Tax=Nodosilinea nodulosa TaxID=416001 RepID=UPI0002FFA289|nr:hypothetical protein [Nodosilinea nodulosa]
MSVPPFLSARPWPWLLSLSALLLVAGAALTSPYGEFKDPAALHRFWTGAAVMGVGFVLSWRLRSVPGVWFWGVALAARLLLLPMAPSDDLWRYLWEGHIQNLGFSPYHLAPNAPELEAYRTAWWGAINQNDVSAIYPPITQLGFRLLAAMSATPALFKLAFVAADLAVAGLLYRRFGCDRATLYAWNPLIIYSFAGGGHYDSWFVLPLVAAWLLDEAAPARRSGLWVAALVGISVAVKWVSLPMVGFLVWRALRQRQWLRSVAIALVGLLPMALSALPFCPSGLSLSTCPLIPTSSVFVSYGRSAEFIPYFAARIWPVTLEANWIYALPLGLVVLGLLARAKTLGQFAEGYWLGLLTLTPIVHAWYFTWMVPFAVPSQNWGVRLVSLSAFVYFVLPSRLPDWRLTLAERLLLWLPLVLGWLAHQIFRKNLAPGWAGGGEMPDN